MIGKMTKKKQQRKKKKHAKKGKNFWGWVIVGCVLGVITATVVIILVYASNSWGLKGVKFSEESGFYGVDTEIEIVPDGVLLMQPIEIKYNMNGDDLANTSERFEETMKLEVPETGYKLYTITAQACKTSDECTTPQVATYILGKNLDEDITIDVININSAQKNLYDYNTGIMVGGRIYDLNYPINQNGYVEGNYNARGKNWMREAYITLFDANGKYLAWDQDAYIEISGGTSSAYNVKSMKITLYPENVEDADYMRTFRLRSGSQDQFTGNIRSSVVSRLVEESGFDGGTDTQRVVVFLNGEYYGIFDMQRNFSEHNLAQEFGIEKENRIKKYKGSEKTVFEKFELSDELWDNLDELENRERLENVIDMDDYLQYFAVQILFNNTDWPMNNFEAWRVNGKNRTDNKYEDGRIRFLVYDTDLIYYNEEGILWFEGSIGDIFKYLMEGKYNGTGSTFKKVMESEYYRAKFIILLEELLDGPFATENVLKVINEEAEKIDHQVKLFSSDEEYQEWSENVEMMKRAAAERENEVRFDIEEYLK